MLPKDSKKNRHLHLSSYKKLIRVCIKLLNRLRFRRFKRILLNS